jgi:hypothetical protein
MMIFNAVDIFENKIEVAEGQSRRVYSDTILSEYLRFE